MDGKSETTIKGIKELDREVSAWQMRLNGLKTDVEHLRAVKDKNEKDIESVRAVATQDISDRLLKARKEQSAVDADREKLASEKAEFEAILKAFKKEKESISAQKIEAEKSKSESIDRMDSAKQFVMLIRREAEKL